MAETKRARVSNKMYLDNDGNETKYAGPETVGLQFTFPDGGTHIVTLDEVGPNCQRIIAWHGLGAKLMDSYAGQANKEETAEELFGVMLERLRADEWVKHGERAGPATGVLFEAVVRALEEAGQTVDDDRKAGIREKIKGKEGREGTLANPVIKAAYEKIRAERAAAKAQAAAKAAEGASLADF